MKLDHDDLNRLIEKISNSDFQEFSLEGEDFKLDIKRNLSDINYQNSLLTKQSPDNLINSNQTLKNENTSTNTSNTPIVPPAAPPATINGIAGANTAP